MASLVKSLLFFVSLFGLIYQLHNVIILYLKYETINQVTLEYPKLVDVPDLVLCHYFANFADKVAAEQLENLLYNDSLTTAVVFEHQPEVGNFFEWCKVHNTNDTKYTLFENCTDHVAVHRLQKNRHICNVMYPKHFSAIDQKLLSGGLDLEQFMHFRYVLNTSFNLPLYFKPRGSPISDNSNSAKYVVRQAVNDDKTIFKDMSVDVAFERTVTQLLPAPFTTNCVDYSTGHDCRSRQDCIDKCIGQKGLALGGVVPLRVATDEATFFKEKLGELDEELFMNISEECEHLFQKAECKTVSYVVSATPYYLSGVEDSIHIFWYPPSKQDILSTAKPRINFEEFVPLCLSLISFWFGLSPFTLDITVAELRRSFGGKFGRKRNRQVMSQQQVMLMIINEIKTQKKFNQFFVNALNKMQNKQ